MAPQAPILLLVGDAPVLSSLQFALSLEGFAVADGAAPEADPAAAACLVVDQGHRGDGLAFLAALRAGGWAGAAILLATHPTRRMRLRAAAAAVGVIEKPLTGDELAQALRAALPHCEAA